MKGTLNSLERFSSFVPHPFALIRQPSSISFITCPKFIASRLLLRGFFRVRRATFACFSFLSGWHRVCHGAVVG
jgi:hypothetical protein